MAFGDGRSDALAGTADLIGEIPFLFRRQMRNDFTMHQQHQGMSLLPNLQTLEPFRHLISLPHRVSATPVLPIAD
jgi:hypothetical protein